MSAAKSHSFGRFVRRGVWLPFVTAMGGVFFTLSSIHSKPPGFISLAKLLAVSQAEGGSNDLYGSIVKTLESSEMRHQVLEHVPGLNEADVVVRVSQNKDFGIFNVAVIGSNKEHVKVFLSALLDEFKTSLEKSREEQRRKAEQPLAEDVSRSEKTVAEEAEKLATLKKTENLEALRSRQPEQAEALKTLMTEKRTLLAAAAGANVSEAERNAEQQRLPILERELASVNLQIADTVGKMAQYARQEKALELAEKDHAEKLELLHKFTAPEVDEVTVMEGASAAVEDVPSRALMITEAAAGGFLGGGVLVLAAAGLWVASRSGRTIHPAPAPTVPPDSKAP